MTDASHGNRFFVRLHDPATHRRVGWATPFFLALAAMITRFHHLKYALAATLVFIGGKIFVGYLFPGGKVPAGWSLGITLGILGTGIAVSLWKTRGAVATS